MSSSRGSATARAAVPTGLQAESWRLLWEEHASDPDAVAARTAWMRARDVALPGLRALLDRFVGGETALEPFRAALDARTKSDWRALALRGPSGAMLLNQLVKRAPDVDALTAALRVALAAPADVAAAGDRLRALLGALTPPVQPARVVAFVAACWHAQAPERWPAYQPSAREALGEEGLFAPAGDAVAAYVAFRLAFLALAAAIGVTGAALEHLCRWHRARTEADADEALDEALDEAPPLRVTARRATVRRPARAVHAATRVAERAPAYAVRVEGDDVRRVPAATPGHTHVQWRLAHLGLALGCRVWIAANDHARTWAGETLGSLSLPRLPRLGLDDESERLVRLIDVVWLSGRHRVAAAFEVEHTTSVHSGLLRMADLAALAPNLSFPMYVVAPRARLPKVRRELARPSLQALGLHRRCGFFAAESLLDSADAIARWGGGAEALARLAEFVGA